MRFSDEQQAIQLANDTEFGLAAYFIAVILAAVSVLPKHWNTAWLASILEQSLMKWHPLAG